MGDALIVGAARSPVGRRGGALAGLHPAGLLGEVVAALVARAGIDPAGIEDLVAGSADPVGEQGEAGELVADRWGLTRQELDACALASHRRAAAAREAGRFDDEIVPLTVERDGATAVVAADEGIRPDTSAEALAGLRLVFRPDGRLTAGNSSQISDGAAAVLIASERAVAGLGPRPRARFHAFAVGMANATLLERA